MASFTYGDFIFSGCSTKTQNYQLRIKNAQQSAIIQKQVAEINVLRKKFRMRQIKTQRSIAAKQRRKQWQNTQNLNLKNII